MKASVAKYVSDKASYHEVLFKFIEKTWENYGIVIYTEAEKSKKAVSIKISVFTKIKLYFMSLKFNKTYKDVFEDFCWNINNFAVTDKYSMHYLYSENKKIGFKLFW